MSKRHREARRHAEAHNQRQRQIRAAAAIAPRPGLLQVRADAIALAVDAGLADDVATTAVDAVIALLPKLASAGADPLESAGPGLVGAIDDPYALDSVLADMRSLLLLGGWVVSTVDVHRKGAPPDEFDQQFALALDSRINDRPELVTHTYLIDLDGLAKLGAEFYALASRAGVLDAFLAAQHDRLEQLPVDPPTPEGT